MRYASIRNFDITNGEGIGIALFVQGCDFHCNGCFNSSTWDFTGGKEWDSKTEEQFIDLASKEYVERITILGGEPMHPVNRDSVLLLCRKLKEKYPNKKIWLYTGYTYETLMNECADLSNIDILIDGRFEKDLYDYKLKWKGSANQRVIDVQQTLIDNTIVLREDNDK